MSGIWHKSPGRGLTFTGHTHTRADTYFCTVERGSSLALTEVNSVCQPSPVFLYLPSLFLLLSPSLSPMFLSIFCHTVYNLVCLCHSQCRVKWHLVEDSINTSKDSLVYLTHVSSHDACWVRASMHCSMLACRRKVWGCRVAVETCSCFRSYSWNGKMHWHSFCMRPLITLWQ